MFLFISSLLLTSVSWAQEDLDQEEVAKSFEELGFVPPFRVTVFRDRADSGDCDPVAARFGKCIELVDFYQPVPVWFWADEYDLLSDDEKLASNVETEKKRMLYEYPNYKDWISVTDEKEKNKLRRSDKATQRLVSELYAETWENIVFQWKEADDAAANAMEQNGFKVLPSPEEQWGYQFYPKRGVISTPNLEYYLSASDWFQNTKGEKSSDLTDLQNKSAFFPRVKQAFPEGYIARPISSVLLAGRFAERLGYKNRVYDYNLMDADPNISGPFFEQIYPYQTIYKTDDMTYIPLTDFRYPSSSAKMSGASTKEFILVAGLEGAENEASVQFDKFYHLITSQILQFAMQDYTDNHMRIMGALTLMRSPPSSLEEATGISRNLNASAQGQTDSKDVLEKSVNDEAYSVPGGFKLNYGKIPDILIVQWLQQLSSTVPLGSEFYFNLTVQAESAFHQLLKSSRPTLLTGVAQEELVKWIEENAGTGVDGNIILKPLRQMALQEIMSSLPELTRDKEETWLMLDHFNYSVISQLDNTVGIRISPSEITDLVAGQWEGVLSSHYYQTKKISQGLGAVDPTAVCTTEDRREALVEPTIGAIYVDQLFAGEDSKLKPKLTGDDLLWAARKDLPIFMFDNPSASRPSIERLVGLPDGEALYRARWTLWSGWHLLWGVEEIDGEHRLNLKTAALCENIVLSPPDLVPTVIRAGLLEDDFYPTTPPKYSDNAEGAPEKKRRKREKKDVKPGDLKTGINKTVSKAKNTDVKAERVGEAIKDPSAINVVTAGNIDLSKVEFAKKPKELPVSIDTRESVDYIKGIVHRPLRNISKADRGLLMLVEDIDQPAKFSILGDTFAHTPYSRSHELTSGFQHVQGAAWGLYFPMLLDDEVVRASPNYVPRANYQIGATVPNWKRKSTADTSFVGDIGIFPSRVTHYSCDSEINQLNLGSTEVCDENTEYIVKTDGIFIGGSSFRTKWFRDDPHLAYELGLSMQLDILHGGKSWFHSEELPDLSIIEDRFNGKVIAEQQLYPTYSVAFRPQTGASFGIRHLVDPMPLSRALRSKTTWGATNSSGSAAVGRMEWGIRGAFLVGPSFNGLEGSLVAETWATGLLRSKNSDWAYFSPYHPILHGGPFVQYKRGGVLIPAEEAKMFNMMYSETVVIGWRTQFRTREDRPE